jgi:hypothetical protein
MIFQVAQWAAFTLGPPSLLTILETAGWIASAILIAELAGYFLHRLKRTEKIRRFGRDHRNHPLDATARSWPVGNVGLEVREFWMEGNWYLRTWFAPARRLHAMIPQRTTKLNPGEFSHRASL